MCEYLGSHHHDPEYSLPPLKVSLQPFLLLGSHPQDPFLLLGSHPQASTNLLALRIHLYKGVIQHVCVLSLSIVILRLIDDVSVVPFLVVLGHAPVRGHSTVYPLTYSWTSGWLPVWGCYK